MKTEPTARPKLYIGIDMHKRNWKIHCATDLFSGRTFGMPPGPDILRHTGITGRAHRLVRGYFIEASWQAIRTDPVMQAYYRKHIGKNVKSIIVKVARKLLGRTMAVIKTRTPYQIGVVG